MEVIIKNFINYLFEYGLVGIQTIKTLVVSYKDIKKIVLNSNIIETKGKLKLILIGYFIKINDMVNETNSSDKTKINTDNYSTNNKLLNSLCDDIVDKYIENQRLEKLKKVKFLFKSYKLNSHNELLKSFAKLKHNISFSITNEKKTNLKVSLLSRELNSIRNNNLNNIIFPNSNTNEIFSNNQQPNVSPYPININGNRHILSKKEEDDLKNCTFKPNSDNLKRSKSTVNFTSSKREEIFSRLHYDYRATQEKKQIKKEANEREVHKNKNFNLLSTSRNHLTGDFINRQINFNKMQKEKKEDLSQRETERILSDCTFRPVLKNHVSNEAIYSHSPRYERLYNLGRKKQKNRSFDQNNYVLNTTYNSDNYTNYNLNNEKKRSATASNRIVDLSIIHNLYNDHKNKKSRAKEILNNFDKEDGITFKPKLMANSKVKVRSTFRERNLSCSKYTTNSKNVSVDKIEQVDKNGKLEKSEKEKAELSNLRTFMMNKLYSSNLNFSSNSNVKNEKPKTKKNEIYIPTSKPVKLNPTLNKSVSTLNIRNTASNISSIAGMNNSNFDSARKSTNSHKDLINFTLNANANSNNVIRSGEKELESSLVSICTIKKNISDRKKINTIDKEMMCNDSSTVVNKTNEFNLNFPKQITKATVNTNYSSVPVGTEITNITINQSKLQKFRSVSLKVLLENKYI